MTTDFSLQKRQRTEQNHDSKLETEYTSKTKPQENGTSNGEQDTESSGLSAKDVTCIENQATGKIRPCNIKDVVLEPIHELWNVNPEFGRASKFINHPNNLPDFTPDT